MTAGLIGREAELERIAAERTAREAHGIVLRAPAGAGKTAVARAAAREAADAGGYVEWVQATRSAASVPLGALAALMGEVERAEDPLQRLTAGARSLLDRANGRKPMLVVDDGQFLDNASAALVLHIATTGTAFVLTTVRSGEPCPDAVVALWKDAGTPRLELDPLDAEHVRALAEAELGGPVQERIAVWLHDSSQGNPLYVRELVAGARESGALVERDGFWVLEGRPEPSASLVDLVEARLSELGVEERRTLGLLALGEPLAPEQLGVDVLADLEERGYVTIGDGLARVAHPLYAEVARATMGSLRVAAAQRRLAELVPDDGTPDTALRRAGWLLEAGETPPLALLSTAADAALSAGDPAFAAHLAQLALDRGAGPEMALVRGRGLWLDGRAEEAEAGLATIDGRIEEPDRAAAYLELRGQILSWALSRHEEALALVERAAGWWDTEEWNAAYAPVRAHLLLLVGQLDSAIETSEQLLADPRLDDAGRRSATLSYARALHWQGRGADARRVLRGSLPAAPRSSQDELILLFWALSAMDTGHDLRELEEWALRAVSHAAQQGSSPVAAVASNALGRIRALEGRFTEARRWLAESSAHHARHNPYGTLVRVRAAQVYVGYMLGEATHAVDQFHEDVDVATTHPTMRAYALQGEAWAALAAGDPPAAERIALGAAEEPRTRAYAAAELTYDALRAGAPAREIAPRLARLRARTDSPLAAAYAEHADALVERSGRALLAAVDAFTAVGALRLACECAADAARVFADEGREDSARRAAARADELHLGGPRPHLGGVGGPSIELTRREAQLVDLASRGLSNAEIADRLVLSTRTVESHLYNAMKKLGVTDRRQL